MSLPELTRFYTALGQVLALRHEMTQRALQAPGAAATQAVVEVARAGGFDVCAADIEQYRALRQSISAMKPLRDTVHRNPALLAELQQRAGGSVASAAPEALCAAYGVLAARLGLPFEAHAMRVAIDTEQMLARPAARGLPAVAVQAQPLLLSLQHAERVSRGNIVQSYPAMEYDVVPQR